MTYQPIVATLGYVMSPDGSQVLLIHRNARPEDSHYGKVNGLGGKLEPRESIADGMRRELFEEAAIQVTAMVLRGSVNWPGFGKHGEDWLGFIFRIDAFTGTPPEHNPEGRLLWHPRTALLDGSLNLWEGDRHFLPLVFDADPRPFHGVMPYVDGHPESWSYTR